MIAHAVDTVDAGKAGKAALCVVAEQNIHDCTKKEADQDQKGLKQDKEQDQNDRWPDQ
jgi:hypothetical protein